MNLFSKSLSLGLCLSLILTSGNVGEAVLAAPSVFAAKGLPPQFALVPPEQLGHLSDYHDASQPGKKNPLVIIIQDLHINFDAQKNIAGLLEFLSEKLASEHRSLGASGKEVAPTHQGTDAPMPPFAVAVEGAQGPIDTSVLATFPDPKIKERAADYLMREGELTGAEYFAAKRGISNLLVGVENGTYYNLHRDLFRKTFNDRQTLVGILKALNHEFKALRKRTYGLKLQNLQKHLDAFEDGKLNVEQFAEAISPTIRQREPSDFDERYPALAHYLTTANSLSQDALRLLTQQFLMEAQARFNGQERQILKTLGNGENATNYFLYLRELVHKHKLFMAVPLELGRYMEWLYLARSGGMDQVQHDAKEWAFDLKLAAAKEGPETDLVQVEHDLELLIKMTNLQVTEAELKTFGPRINRFVAMAQTLSPSTDAARLQGLISTSVDYYAMALMRNQPMVENTLTLISPRLGDLVIRKLGTASPQSPNHPITQSPSVAVLIAGGFHTFQITEMLKARNVSYVVMTPTVTHIPDTDHGLYVKRLRGDLLTVKDVLAQAAQKDAFRLAGTSNKKGREALHIGFPFGLKVGRSVAVLGAAIFGAWAVMHNVTPDAGHFSQFFDSFASWTQSPGMDQGLSALKESLAPSGTSLAGVGLGILWPLGMPRFTDSSGLQPVDRLTAMTEIIDTSEKLTGDWTIILGGGSLNERQQFANDLRNAMLEVSGGNARNFTIHDNAEFGDMEAEHLMIAVEPAVFDESRETINVAVDLNLRPQIAGSKTTSQSIRALDLAKHVRSGMFYRGMLLTEVQYQQISTEGLLADKSHYKGIFATVHPNVAVAFDAARPNEESYVFELRKTEEWEGPDPTTGHYFFPGNLPASRIQRVLKYGPGGYAVIYERPVDPQDAPQELSDIQIRAAEVKALEQLIQTALAQDPQEAGRIAHLIATLHSNGHLFSFWNDPARQATWLAPDYEPRARQLLLFVEAFAKDPEVLNSLIKKVGANVSYSNTAQKIAETIRAARQALSGPIKTFGFTPAGSATAQPRGHPIKQVLSYTYHGTSLFALKGTKEAEQKGAGGYRLLPRRQAATLGINILSGEGAQGGGDIGQEYVSVTHGYRIARAYSEKFGNGPEELAADIPALRQQLEEYHAKLTAHINEGVMPKSVLYRHTSQMVSAIQQKIKYLETTPKDRKIENDRLLDIPIVIGFSRSLFDRQKHSFGGESFQESHIDYLDLKEATHVYVPEINRAEVMQFLAAEGLTHIEVVPMETVDPLYFSADPQMRKTATELIDRLGYDDTQKMGVMLDFNKPYQHSLIHIHTQQEEIEARVRSAEQLASSKRGTLTHRITSQVGDIVGGLLFKYYKHTHQIEEANNIGVRHSSTRRYWIQEEFAPPFEFWFFTIAGKWFESIHSPLKDAGLAAARARRAARLQKFTRAQFARAFLQAFGKEAQATMSVPVWMTMAGTGFSFLGLMPVPVPMWLNIVRHPVRAVLAARAAYRLLPEAKQTQYRWHKTFNRRHRDDGAALTQGVSVQAPFLPVRTLSEDADSKIQVWDYQLLRILDPETKITLFVPGRRGFGEDQVTWTVAETIRYFEKEKPESFRLDGIHPSESESESESVEDSKLQEKGAVKYGEYPETYIFHTHILLASGETVAFAGNKAMLARLAKEASVVRVDDTRAYWTPLIRFYSDVPFKEHQAGFDWKHRLRLLIHPSIILDSTQTDVAGMTVYHGTSKLAERSVKEGPKNIGKGFGGAGLYLAPADNFALAKYFADSGNNRQSALYKFGSGPLQDTPPDQRKPIVMSGRVTQKALRIGRFQVLRNQYSPDLGTGKLPPDWSYDPNLQAFFHEEFDVLDLREMNSSGLAIDANRMLVVHERAGLDAIAWNDQNIPTLHGGTHRFAALMHIMESGELGAVKPTDVVGINGETVRELYDMYKAGIIHTTNGVFNAGKAKRLVPLIRQHGYITDPEKAKSLRLEGRAGRIDDSGYDIHPVNIVFDKEQVPLLNDLQKGDFHEFVSSGKSRPTKSMTSRDYFKAGIMALRKFGVGAWGFAWENFKAAWDARREVPLTLLTHYIEVVGAAEVTLRQYLAFSGKAAKGADISVRAATPEEIKQDPHFVARYDVLDVDADGKISRAHLVINPHRRLETLKLMIPHEILHVEYRLAHGKTEGTFADEEEFWVSEGSLAFFKNRPGIIDNAFREGAIAARRQMQKASHGEAFTTEDFSPSREAAILFGQLPPMAQPKNVASEVSKFRRAILGAA